MINKEGYTISYQKELDEWRQFMDDNLRKEDSWLALAGLYWLEEGENSFGTDPGNDIVLDVVSGPGRIGIFTLKDGIVNLNTQDDVLLRIDGKIQKEGILKPDSSGSPTEIKLEFLTFILLDREDGLAIRVWDNQRPEKLYFPGRRWLPVNEDLRIQGHYHRFQEELDLVFSRKNGADYQETVQGEIRFILGEKEYSLVAFEREDGTFFTLFYDSTNGKESYPAGRFLLIDPPQDGHLEIDFNKAYNPPCAFTDYATCPIPPAQNKLDFPIMAGEKI